jgi:hypothetical protein
VGSIVNADSDIHVASAAQLFTWTGRGTSEFTDEVRSQGVKQSAMTFTWLHNVYII